MNKTELRSLYDAQIVKYKGEVKGFAIMLEREKSNDLAADIKELNVKLWKKELRKSRYNLTTLTKLRKAL